MADEVIIVETLEPEAEEPSTERTLGRLEAETEHLSEEVEEATEAAEEAQEAAEIAETIAESAAETAWDARAAISELREEIPAIVAAEIGRLSDVEDDQESSETEIVELPETFEEPETVPDVSSERTGFSAILGRILH